MFITFDARRYPAYYSSQSTFWAQWCTWLLIGIGVITGIIIALVILVGLGDRSPRSSRSIEQYCLTPTCVVAASDILRTVDQSVDPCENFYEFVCGGFHNSVHIPEKMKTFDYFVIAEHNIKRTIETIIEKPIELNEPKFITITKNLFRSCTNRTIIKKEKYLPLMKIFKSLGGWPVLEDAQWDESKFNWIENDRKLRRLGIQPVYFINFGITIDPEDQNKFILYLDKPTFHTSFHHLLSIRGNETASNYYTRMVNFAVMLGGKRVNAQEELLKSLNFEIDLADIIIKSQDVKRLKHSDRGRVTESSMRMTIAKLIQYCPNIPWLHYINGILPTDTKVDKREMLIVDWNYIEKFVELINVTPRRIQANYALWRCSESIITHIDPLKLHKNDIIRFEYCHDVVRLLLPVAVSSLYLRANSNADINRYISEMVMDIREQFMKTINTADWLDELSMQNALNRLENMKAVISAHDKLLNETVVNEYHENLHLDGEHFLFNFLNVTRMETDASFRRLRKTVRDSLVWKEFAKLVTTPNAVYYMAANTIIISSGLLQNVFFNINLPRYMNYGCVGSIIGHEMNHGFHGTVNTPSHLKLANYTDWWTPNVLEKFTKKTQCLVQQYNRYRVVELNLKVNGSATLNENIADNGGFKIAYLAYDNWSRNNGPDPMLPGIPFTDRQLFWISSVRHLCSKDRLEYVKQLMLYDFHTLRRFRVLGTLSNLPEFSRDFKCPLGSNMNPVNKCHFW